MDISFKGRDTQFELYQTILASAQGILPYKYIDSGGAIRGAKSFTNSLALLTLCKSYPNSKWGVIRKDLTILETTTIETINKIIRGLPNWRWNKNRANYHLTYEPNGARVLFIGANEARDKDFTDTLGLEINGVFFDQLEDVSQEYYNAVLQRVGSWHIPNEPKPLVLTTFNPHPGWIKKEKYLRWKNGEYGGNEIYFPLSPINEPSNTKDQWEVWNAMPPDVKARMIEGDWNSFENKNPFFYGLQNSMLYDESYKIHSNSPIYLSFDFNIDPATCTVFQAVPNVYINVLKSYKINNTTLKDLCARIKSEFNTSVIKVTGDPSGNARHSGFNSVNETMYKIIQASLNISYSQIDKPELNFSKGEESWRELRIFCNTILQNHPNIKFFKEAKDTFNDLRIATTIEGSDKMYKTSGNTEYGMHLADGFIYFLTTYFNNFVKRQIR